jgi:hypothetical protein
MINTDNVRSFQDRDKGRAFLVAKENFLCAVAADRRLTPSAFKVAWFLSHRAHRTTFYQQDTLDAWPKMETIAERCGTTKRTVIDAVRLLQGAGYLQIWPGNTAERKSNGYRLYVPGEVSSPAAVQFAQKRGEENTPEPLDVNLTTQPALTPRGRVAPLRYATPQPDGDMDDFPD